MSRSSDKMDFWNHTARYSPSNIRVPGSKSTSKRPPNKYVPKRSNTYATVSKQMTGLYAHTQTQRDRKWLSATWLGGGLNPIVMAIHERSFWLEARPISRSLARLSGGVPNVQCSCIAIIQAGLHLLLHDLLQFGDVVRRWLDFKRDCWFRTSWHKNDNPN